jgi:O-methyltransferase
MFDFDTANLLLRRPNNFIDSSIISKDQIRIILSILGSIIDKDIPGDIVEFGCFVGESSKYIRMLLDNKLSQKKIYVYDSFEGLPELSNYEKNTGWKPGTLKTTQEILLSNFYNNGLNPPIITKAWFRDIRPEQLPEKISFGFLDGDFYESIRDSLNLVYPKISVGGCLVLHDYERNDLPGVKAALDNYINCIDSDSYIIMKPYDQLGLLIKTKE